jgi:dihydrolipoamide dehydrogenase
MKEYGLILIGTGSAMNIVNPFLQRNPQAKIAVIDKDDPGGICLTKGCIPSKILLYPAELVRTIQQARDFGLDVDLKKINFNKIMDKMRTLISRDINMIRRGLSQTRNLDYYTDVAKFVAPYTLMIGEDTITSKLILLCTGSKPLIPPISGLKEAGYLTSDTVLNLTSLPKSVAIIGGGYIAAEYGHFLSAMGSTVTIFGRNPQFLKEEEPEVSALAKKELQRHMTIYTNHEVQKAEKTFTGKKRLHSVNKETHETKEITADEILVAAGRVSNTDILAPEKGGIETDAEGWIIVNEHLETSQPNIWALGDANGKHPFKHVGNYESLVVYYNAILKEPVKVDYHAIPHAVFTYPEIASVGLRETEAIEKHGEDNVLIGMQRYQDTAKGEAMDVTDYFVKVLIEKGSMRILGAHIIGPQASVLIQEIINLMYTPSQSARPIMRGMHIHPALSEVVERAFHTPMPPKQYHHVLEHHH